MSGEGPAVVRGASSSPTRELPAGAGGETKEARERGDGLFRAVVESSSEVVLVLDLDGSGYHRGVTGEGQDARSRLLAVADVFDALTQDRPYRPAMPTERALTVLRFGSGTKPCPAAVGAPEELVSAGKL